MTAWTNKQLSFKQCQFANLKFIYINQNLKYKVDFQQDQSKQKPD